MRKNLFRLIRSQKGSRLVEALPVVRGVTFASRSHLADVAGRHAVAFLRALFEDKLLQFVGLRLVLLQTT